MEEVTIPEYIDSPPQFLIWEIDDVAPILFGMLIGTVARYVTQNGYLLWVGVFLGFILSYFYIKFKANRLPGTLAHMLYSYTGLMPLNKHFTNGLLQETHE